MSKAELGHFDDDRGLYGMVEICGVYVLVYVRDGRLIISTDIDESELDDPARVEIKMSGETVWEAS